MRALILIEFHWPCHRNDDRKIRFNLCHNYCDVWPTTLPFAALVERDKVDAVIEKLNTEYYDKNGYPHLARAYRPGKGSSIEF